MHVYLGAGCISASAFKISFYLPHTHTSNAGSSAPTLPRPHPPSGHPPSGADTLHPPSPGGGDVQRGSLPGRTSPSGPQPAKPAQLSTRTSLPLAPAKPTHNYQTVHPHLTHCTHTHPSPITCRITKYTIKTTQASFKTSNWRAKCQ